MYNVRCAFLILVLVVTVQGAAPLFYPANGKINPGIFLVVLDDGVSIAERDNSMNSLLRSISSLGTGDNSQVLSLFNIGSFVGYTARLSLRALVLVRNLPRVKYVEADQEMFMLDVQTGATWGLDRSDQRALPLDGLYNYNTSAGSGVDVYVIDTGIRITHQEFQGRAAYAFNAVLLEPDDDLNGHGTHCAGTVAGATYGIAKRANVFGVKVLNGRGSGSTTSVINGINYVTNNRDMTRPAVASMSLGGGASNALDDAVAQSISSGVVYAIAAGNSNADACNTSPARVRSAISVGATDSSDNRASYSNFGMCVSIFAPGSNITSAWIGGDTATNTISGTSMATPHVAGALALHLSDYPTLSPAENKAWLLSVATSGVVVNPGAGSPNLLLYTPYV